MNEQTCSSNRDSLSLIDQFIRFYAVFFFFFLSAVILFPPSLLAYPFSQHVRNKIIHPAWHLFAKIFIVFIMFLDLDEEDLRSLEDQNRPQLIIANHRSVMDTPLLVIHHKVGPIMKKEVLKLPFFGFAAQVAGSLAVERKDPVSRKKVYEMALRKWKNGEQILYFPEGTRKKQKTPLGETKTKLIEAAFRESIPVCAVALSGTEDILRKGFVPHLGTKVRMRSSKLFWPKEFSDVHSFAQTVWAATQED